MAKYLIKARIEVDGIVDKPDVIGAIFGQTEGLFGSQLDLRELQDKGRIGRIQVDLKVHGNKTIGDVVIPSNLDRVETALVAAMLETVDRVGPYPAKLRVVDIVDLRIEKIKKITERAKEILQKWSMEKAPDLKEILSEIAEVLRTSQITKYGPEGLPAGPDIDKSDTIIIVEGRADVLNLLKYGYTNVIAIEGARSKIPDTIVKLCKEKKCIAFVDGDHGGELILRELLRSVRLHAIARAPPGKEVEELTGKEISRALKNVVPAEQYKALLEKEHRRERPRRSEREEKREPRERIEAKAEKPIQPIEQPTTPIAQPASAVEVSQPQPIVEVKPREAVEKVAEVGKAEKPRPPKGLEEYVISFPDSVLNEAKKLQGTLEAILYDESWNVVKRLPVRDLFDELKKIEPGKVYAIVFDGIVTQRLADIASEKKVRLIVGARIGGISKRPYDVEMLTFNDIL